MTYATIENYNIALFQWINASSQPPALTQGFAFFTAEILIYILTAGIVIAWIARPQGGMRSALLYAVLSAGLALGINQLIGLFYYHPRPFEMGIGHTLTKHVLETSFPSDHGTVFFSMGLALLWVTQTRRWGWLITGTGLAVAWSRIYLGVHFPLDMLGALLVSLLATGIMLPFYPVIEKTLQPAITRLYEYFVKMLRLPTSLFPLARQYND